MSSFLLATLQDAQRQRNLNDDAIRGMYSSIIPEEYNNRDHNQHRGQQNDERELEERDINTTTSTTTNATFVRERMFNPQRTFGMGTSSWFSRYPDWRHQLVVWEIQERFRRSIAYIVILFLLLRTCTEAMIHDDFGLLLIGIFLTTCFIKVLERRQAESNIRRNFLSRVGAEDEEESSDGLSILMGDGTPPSSLLQTQLDMQQFGQISARSNMPLQVQLAFAMMQSQQHAIQSQMVAGMMQRQRGQRNLMQLGVRPEIQHKWQRFYVKEDNNDNNSSVQAQLCLIPKQRPPPMRPHETEDLEVGATASDGDHMMQSNESTSRAAPPAAKATIPIDPCDNSCSICLSTYETGETVVKFPCGHLFHDGCAKEWLERSVKCPLCNQTLDRMTEEEN